MTNQVGNPGDDTLRGTQETDRIWGLSGNDDIDAGGGNDLVNGGDGNDLLTSSSGYDRLDGGEGDDRIVLIGTGGAVTGGAGFDTLVVDLSMTSNQIMFGGANGHAIIGHQSHEQQIFFHDIERLELTTGSGDDLVQGSAFDDNISTGAGADFIGWSWPDPDSEAGSAGDDVVDAGAGDDTIIDRHGANHLFGGDGNDSITTTLSSAEIDGGDGYDALWLDEGGRTDDVTIDFVAGSASTGAILRGIEQADIVMGSGNDMVIATSLASVTVDAGAGDDRVEGGAGDDDVRAGDGADYLAGGAGNDTLRGGSGSDQLLGGEGEDILSGNDGTDVLSGGAGADTFLWGAEMGDSQGVDRIVDFDAQGGDVIEFGVYRNSLGMWNYDAFLDASKDTAEGVYVEFHEGHGILIEGVTIADLSPHDFIF